MRKMEEKTKVVKAVGPEGLIWFVLIISFFAMFGMKMGVANMFGTMMATAHDLVINTCFLISAVCILAGAVSAIFSEFGVLALANMILSPLMKPLYNLPGVSVIGVMATYLSDNPAILSLAADRGFCRYFKRYQYVSLTNLGTSFGMGLIVGTFMVAQGSITGESYLGAVLTGTLGAVIGSIVSVRIMQFFSKREYGTDEGAKAEGYESKEEFDVLNFREIRVGNRLQRFMEALLDGAKTGFNLSLLVIPGVATICTVVMMLTNGPGAEGVYTGAAYEGIAVLPVLGRYLNIILDPLLGFQDPSAIAFPLTSLGAVGAAIGIVPQLLREGRIGANEIAVFTAMGMCWSGYLSTHVAMMEAINSRKMTMKAILSHTIGGFLAGVCAHFFYVILL